MDLGQGPEQDQASPLFSQTILLSNSLTRPFRHWSWHWTWHWRFFRSFDHLQRQYGCFYVCIQRNYSSNNLWRDDGNISGIAANDKDGDHNNRERERQHLEPGVYSYRADVHSICGCHHDHQRWRRSWWLHYRHSTAEYHHQLHLSVKQ